MKSASHVCSVGVGCGGVSGVCSADAGCGSEDTFWLSPHPEIIVAKKTPQIMNPRPLPRCISYFSGAEVPLGLGWALLNSGHLGNIENGVSSPPQDNHRQADRGKAYALQQKTLLHLPCS